ncbi:carbohydrate ABC transporter permease [Cellulomonas endophytica]|uniref:carbohydrate ABC transporter permease n=1 Tax=Cellulomonas endophytica TaxID=2494735 RepID=UPI001F0CC735|nr:sugar ABC transporter permease [Cellulomonas endophytica]
MSTVLAAPAGTAPAARRGGSPARPGRMVLGILGVALVAWLVINIFLSIAWFPGWYLNNRLLMAVVGILAGLGGAALLFYFANVFAESLPQRLSQGVIPYIFLLPAFGFISLMLLYPTVQTINYSFAGDRSTEYVGFDNYAAIFSSGEFWLAITNNLLWLAIVPAVTVAFGVVVALFADRLPATGEKVAKSLIFLPMAISFVGAATIWRLVYNLDEDTGLLNAIITGLGGTAQDWLRFDTARLNSLLMMVILVWLQVGFAMVLLSGAIKAVPEETLEAARLDGANERQLFFRVIIPQIRGTILTVFITVLILVLKVFDIIYVLTNGQARTNVIAVLFFQELFTAQRAGQASAIVVILLLLVLPVLLYQVRSFREETR